MKNTLDKKEIEHRPIVSGNLLLHPFLAKWKDQADSTNANILNYNGVYVGNNQFVTLEMMEVLKGLISYLG